MEEIFGLIENYLRDMHDGEYELTLYISNSVYDSLLNVYSPESLNNLFNVKIKPIKTEGEAEFMFIAVEPLIFEEEELKMLVN